jgi:hypothetical protein
VRVLWWRCERGQQTGNTEKTSENYEIEILNMKQKSYIQNLNNTNTIYADESKSY